ncbi:hypothetical protein ACRZPD_001112 [Enterobacter kobei]
MSTITREQAKDLRNAFECWQQDYDPVEDKEQYDMFGLGMVAMDALLASLEAEAVCVIDQSNLDYLKSGSDADVWPASRTEMGDVLLYRSPPPATVSVPDDVMAAMQKVARIRLDLNDFDGDKRGILDCLGDAEEALIEVVNLRAAMLQGVEQQNRQQNIPENIPTLRDGLAAIRNSGIAIDAEKIFAERDALNDPVIPDGWVMVPVEPTDDMIVNGFESEPDESFSDEKEWEAYDAMSGCQQAAHRAKLCWAAMIKAAPKLE